MDRGWDEWRGLDIDMDQLKRLFGRGCIP